MDGDRCFKLWFPCEAVGVFPVEFMLWLRWFFWMATRDIWMRVQ